MATQLKSMTREAGRRGRGGMPRPLRRAQLAQLAETILLRDGVSAVTMSRVAAEAGVARTVIYSHFENASSILLTAVERHWAVIDQQFEPVAGVRPFEERLRRHAQVYLGDSAPDRLELRRLLDCALRDDLVNVAYQKRQHVRRAAWSRRIQADVGLSTTAADFVALSLLETLSALGAVLYEDPQACDTAVDVFVRGIMGMARSLR